MSAPRRDIDDLIRRTPADGLVAGFGRVNGDRFDDAAAQCVVLSYDYTVLAGTHGFLNHRKKDRLFELAERWRTPVVFFIDELWWCEQGAVNLPPLFSRFRELALADFDPEMAVIRLTHVADLPGAARKIPLAELLPEARS